MTYPEARAIADTRPSVDGIGFVLTDNDPFVCVDFDDVIADSGAVARWAVAAIVQLDSYTEYSPSKTGFHTLTTGTKPDGRTSRKQGNNTKVEVFDSSFVTFTGDHLAGTPTTVEPRDDALTAIYDELVAGDDDGSSSTTAMDADIDIHGTVNDGELDESLVHRMCAGLSDLYGRIPPRGIAADELNALLAGDYEAAYGDDDGDGGGEVDRSEAELITATLLVGVAHDHTDIEPDDVPAAVAHLLTDRCRKKPFVDDGRPRKWASRGESYRTDIIQSAVEQFNPRIFELWTLKTHRTDYSYLTYQFAFEATHQLHDKSGYPTSEEIAIRAAVIDFVDGGDGRTVNTYKNALSRLVNHHERLQRAKIQGTNRHVYYPTRVPDPADAEYVVCGERREPEPKPPENTHT